MSVTYGVAVGTGTKFRVGIEQVIPTPSVSDLTVTVTTKVWVWTKDKVTDSSVSLTLSGNGTDAGTYPITVNTVTNTDWSTKNKVLVYTSTKDVPTSALAQAITSTASVTGIDAAGAATTATFTVNGTLTPSPSTPPAAPSDCTATLVNGAANLAWSNGAATATSPYMGIQVWRWDNVVDDWYLLKTLGVVTSFTDTTVAGDRHYQYRVCAINGGGSSAFATAPDLIETTPATPAAPTAKRPAVNVEVSWVVNSTIAVSYELWHAADGVLDGAALATVAASTASYTHVGASTSADHTYFLKAVGASLTSPLSAPSSVVAKLAAPLSPSNLAPSGRVLDAADAVTLTFTHNAADGTGMVGFKPKWRPQGTDVWITPDGQALSGSADTSTDAITCAGHSLNLGDVVTFTGTLPAPLVAGLNYFAVPIDATRFYVALTEEDAEDNILVNLTSTGGPFTVLNGRVVSNVPTFNITGGSLIGGTAYEWTVSTDGRYNGTNPSSPFASVAGFRTATKPTLTLSTPLDGGTLGSPQAMVAWIFYSPDAGVAQQWAEVSLWQGSTLLEIYESAGEWFSYPFATNLINGAEYRIEVQAEGSNGIRSDIYSATFTTEYIGPATPGLALTWDGEDGLVIIDISNPDDGDSPLAVSNRLERSVAGGEWELILDGLPTDTTVIDYLPTPNKVNAYRVTATADDGSTEVHEASVMCNNSGDWYWLNAGDSFDVIAKVRYDAGTTVTFGLEKALHNFAGRTRPVEFTGTIRNHVIDLTALLSRDEEGYQAEAELMAVVEAGGPVYYRDPVGRRLKCSIGEIEMADADNLIQFRTTLREVD